MDEKNCGNNCAECCEQEKCIPFFDHLHKKHTEEAMRIKVKQGMYKE